MLPGNFRYGRLLCGNVLIFFGECRVMIKQQNTKKIYILDTNVLVLDPQSIFSFDNELIGIPAVVLEELDKFKQEASDRGRNTREVIKYLDALRQQGSLKDGVRFANDSILKVLFLDKTRVSSFPFKLHIEDNVILLTAVMLKNEGFEVIFVSRDLNARVKADALGIESQDYAKERISVDEFYKGWVRVQAPAVQLKREYPEVLMEVLEEQGLALNEFVLVESLHNPFNYRIFRYTGGSRFKAVHDPALKWPLKARNPQQLMALDLLLDSSIQLVNLVGPAGTGKTFLALLAGLHQVLIEDEYERILISRPVVPLGRDIGFLPGTLEEKLHSWMLPIYDNMDFIIHSASVGQHFKELEHETYGLRKKKRLRPDKKSKLMMPTMEELVHSDKISLEAITYMRGRSIPYQYILIDEVQNLTPHEVKTLISRVGMGSKMILSGDPYQIDAQYLDFSSNGLTVATERFKGQDVFGTVFLETSERSHLSDLAAKLL